MNTAKDIADELLRKVKSMQTFEIIREVEDNWLPLGVVPFDVSIKNNVAKFTVYAETYIDAEDQVTQYLERDENE
jgi:hypothetical protein